MKEIYQEYLQAKAGVWSATSQHTERYRLNKIMHLLAGDADALWLALESYGAYSRTTMWTRITDFWNWGIQNKGFQSPNPYVEFRKKNVRAFRGCYQRKPCNTPFDEMMAKIESCPDEQYRNKMKQLLIGALRVTESDTLKDGVVIGKGSKPRKVHVPDLGPMITKAQYSGLLRRCHKYLGVTPHKLRSCRMSDLADNGANMFELMKIAGWSNASTAQSYIEARDDKVKELMERRREAKTHGLMGVLKLIAKTVVETVKG